MLQGHPRHPLHLDARMPEILHHFPLHQIYPVAEQRIRLQRRGEVDGIEEITFCIQEGAEFHQLALFSPHRLRAHEVPHHPHHPPDVVSKLGGGDLPSVRTARHRKQWSRDREPQ